MMHVDEYRNAFPEETRGYSDFELVTALHKQHGQGRTFDDFAHEFLTRSTDRSIPDRTPQPKPAVPSKGLFGSVSDHIAATKDIAAASLMTGAGGFIQRADNLIDSISDAQDSVFGYHWIKGGGFDKAAKYLLEHGEELRKAAQDHGPGFADEMIGEAIGGAVPGIFEFSLGVPWATMTGASEAHRKGNSAVVGALSHGIKQYFLQRIFGGIHGMQRAGKLTKGALTGTVFGLDTAIEGGGARDIAKAFGTGMLYQFIPGGPGKRGAEAKTWRDAEAQIMRFGLEKEEAAPPTPAEKEVLAAEGSVSEAPAKVGDRRASPRPGQPDRRASADRPTEELTLEELRKLRKTHDVSEHPNGIALADLPPERRQPVVAFADIQGLKFINDNYSHEAGDAAIKAVSSAMYKAGLGENSFHLHGDEYVAQFPNVAAAETSMAKVKAELGKIRIDVTGIDGKPYTLSGLALSHGITEAFRWTNREELKTELGRASADFERQKKAEVEAGNRTDRAGKPASVKVEPAEPGAESGRAEQTESAPTEKAETIDGRRSPAELERDQLLHQEAETLAKFLKDSGVGIDLQPVPYNERGIGLNLDRLGKTPADVKRILDMTALLRQKDIAEHSGVTRPLAEIKQRARSLAKSVGMEDRRDFVESLERDAKQMEERMVAARQILADQAMLVDKLLKETEAGGDGASGSVKVAKVRFLQELDYLNEIMPVVLGARGHIARATTAGRIPVNGRLVEFKEITPEVAKSLEVETTLTEVLDRLGGEDAFAKIAKDWKSKKDLPAKMKYVREQRGSKALNALLEFRATNMLSSINTALVNTTSNLTRQLLDNYVENPIAAILGNRNREAGQDRMTMQEAKVRAFSFTRYLFDGFRAIPGNLRSGARSVKEHGFGAVEQFNKAVESSGPDPLKRTRATEEGYASAAMSREYLQDTRMGQRINALGTIGDLIWRGVDMYGSLARALSFGSLNLSDNFFKQVAYRTEVDGLLFREALKRGVGEGASDRAAEVDSWLSKQSELVNGYSQGKEVRVSAAEKEFILSVHDSALKRAREATWQRDLEGAAKRIEQGLREAPAWKLVIPFYKTPVNLLSWIPEHTPLLWRLSRRMKADIAEGGALRDQAHAKIITGTLLYAAAAALFANGMLTGSHDPKERQVMSDAQIGEYSIYLNGKWYQYNRTDPFGFMLGMVADIGYLYDKMPEQKWEQLAAGLILSLGNNVLSKTWATTLSDIFALSREPQRYQEGFFSKYASTLLPMGGLARSVNERLDEHARETRSMADVALNTYLSSANPVRLDDFGEEVPDLRRFMGAAVRTPRQDSPVRMEFAFLHIPTQMPKDKLVYAADMTDEQFYRFRQNLHELQMEDTMNELVRSEGYADIDNLETRRKVLTEFRDKFFEAARAMLLEDPETADAYEREIDRFFKRYSKVTPHDPKAHVSNWREFLVGGLREQ